MPSDYKSNKINENALTKCNKCDCLILSDSSDSKNDKCINLKKLNHKSKGKNYELSSGDADESVDSNEVCKSFCVSRQNSVKIIVNAELDNGDSSTEKAATDSDNCACKGLKTDLNMKHVCFRFCRKKKDKKDVATDTNKVKTPMQDDGNQTSTVALPESKEPAAGEPNIKEIVQRCCNCKPTPAGGGCNTNTIIFPRDKTCESNLANVENCIRLEARANARNLEEILNELSKQRREIREVRDLLDIIVRILREQFDTMPPTKNQKTYPDAFEDFCRKTCLERKSNTLSMAPSNNKNIKPTPIEVRLLQETSTTADDGKPKKKRFFSWCK